MTNEEWTRLVRIAKNDNDYYKLTSCVRIYVKYYKYQSICKFLTDNTFFDIKDWYKHKGTYEYWKRIGQEHNL